MAPMIPALLLAICLAVARAFAASFDCAKGPNHTVKIQVGGIRVVSKDELSIRSISELACKRPLKLVDITGSGVVHLGARKAAFEM